MDTLQIIGISIETTNQNGQSARDLGQLWGRFYAEGILDKIANKADNDVYSIYTDYESDYTGKYTTIIGAKVTSLAHVPAGLVGRSFGPQNFKKFTAKGTMPQAVVDSWKEIWAQDKQLNRAYTYDYELYGDRCQNETPEVDIFIAVKA